LFGLSTARPEPRPEPGAGRTFRARFGVQGKQAVYAPIGRCLGPEERQRVFA